jgi:purine-nucleoside phosphorylase
MKSVECIRQDVKMLNYTGKRKGKVIPVTDRGCP